MTDPVGRLVDGVLAGHRASVSQAITLVESSKPSHRAQARDLLAGLEAGPERAPAVRVGISGVPGVGKSTFIETLGSSLTSAGHRVGVLAVDPSSTRTGGSVLGDKTRMARLAVDPAAFVRPSPQRGHARRGGPGDQPGDARCSRRRRTTSCWWRPSASASPRSPSRAWSTRSCS